MMIWFQIVMLVVVAYLLIGAGLFIKIMEHDKVFGMRDWSNTEKLTAIGNWLPVSCIALLGKLYRL